MSIFTQLLAPVTDLIKEPLKGWQERKTIATKSKTRVAELNAEAAVANGQAKLELAKNGQAIQADWDSTAQEQMKFSWKDEVLMLVIMTPFVGSFIPGVQDYVKDGWVYVATAPSWWTFSFLGIIAAVFGLRWLIAPLVKKMGLNPVGKG